MFQIIRFGRIWPIFILAFIPKNECSMDYLYASRISGKLSLVQGETLKLNCSLSPYPTDLGPNYTVQHIGFWFLPQNADTLQCIPSEYISTVDDIAMLVIPNVSYAWAGSYSCSLDDVPCNESTSHTIGIADDFVHIHPPTPANVTNFRCVLHDWDVRLKCTWKHPKNNYINWPNIRVDVFWAINSWPRAYLCRKVTPTSCIWELGKDLMGFTTLKVEVAVTDTIFNISTAKAFVAYESQIVKPTPIDRLYVQPSTTTPSSCIDVMYNHPRASRNKRFKIRAKPLVLNGTFVTLADDLRETYRFTTCSLDPRLAYILSVEVYPLFPYAGYWSNPTYTIITAQATEPSGAVASASQCTPFRTHIYNVCTFGEEP